LRESDHGARCGGEELGVILPDTGLEQAGAAAERLRHALESLKFEGNLVGTQVTASFGVATARGSRLKEDVDVLIAEADRALYAAKAEGRNRVVLASSLPSATHA